MGLTGNRWATRAAAVWLPGRERITPHCLPPGRTNGQGLAALATTMLKSTAPRCGHSLVSSRWRSRGTPSPSPRFSRASASSVACGAALCALAYLEQDALARHATVIIRRVASLEGQLEDVCSAGLRALAQLDPEALMDHEEKKIEKIQASGRARRCANGHAISLLRITRTVSLAQQLPGVASSACATMGLYN